MPHTQNCGQALFGNLVVRILLVNPYATQDVVSQRGIFLSLMLSKRIKVLVQKLSFYFVIRDTFYRTYELVIVSHRIRARRHLRDLAFNLGSNRSLVKRDNFVSHVTDTS
jgi:hypothetical protein